MLFTKSPHLLNILVGQFEVAIEMFIMCSVRIAPYLLDNCASSQYLNHSVEWLSSELESIWKEAVTVLSRYYFAICADGLIPYVPGFHWRDRRKTTKAFI